MNDAPQSEPRATASGPILVVGSRQTDVFVLEAVLADLGRPILRATTGQEAVRLAVDQEPAVVLLDVLLADMSGFEVLSLLRMRRRTRATPVLLHATSELSRDEMRAAMEAGVVDVVHKPFDGEALRTKVGAFVQLHGERSRVDTEIVALRTAERALRARLTACELELAATQARLRLAADAACAGLWDLEPARRIVRCDPQASRIFGLPPHMLVDAGRWLSGADEASRRRLDERIERALLEGEGGRLTTELVVRGGQHAWDARRLSLRAQVVGAGQGALLVVGTVTELGPAIQGDLA